ncbi:hypothetical protein IID22_05020 [Patescibacteria group bacterium]|nr:hypothetical protein [Patescibacteria group bacterium]
MLLGSNRLYFLIKVVQVIKGVFYFINLPGGDRDIEIYSNRRIKEFEKNDRLIQKVTNNPNFHFES